MYRAWLLQTIAGHILYSALACANLLLELLQETAARIYLRLSVTPCSAAVRAQHSAAPEGVHGVLESKTLNERKPKKAYYKGIYITFDVWIQHGWTFPLQPSSKL